MLKTTGKIQLYANRKAVKMKRNEEENRFEDGQCKNTFAFIVSKFLFGCLHFFFRPDHFLIQFECYKWYTRFKGEKWDEQKSTIENG